MLRVHHPISRNNVFDAPLDLPSPSPSNFNTDFFNTIPHTTCTPSPAEIKLRHYFGSLENISNNNSNDLTSNLDNIFSTDSNGAALNKHMGDFDFSSPAIRVQQSTPVPQLPANYSQSQYPNNWRTMYGGQVGLQTPIMNRTTQSHHRATSSSSAGSEFSSASINHASTNAHATASYPADEASRAYSTTNHLPTPSQTPTTDMFSQSYQNFHTVDASMQAHYSMKHALLDGTGNLHDEEVPGFAPPSSRQSVSSYGHNSPATPHGDDFDEKLRGTTGEKLQHQRIEDWIHEYLLTPDDTDPPIKFENHDEMLPASHMGRQGIPRSQGQHIPNQSSLLSPFSAPRSGVSANVYERLQAAHKARSQSPSTSMSRAASPFHQSSPHALSQNSFGSPQRANPSTAMKNYAQQSEQEPKTISPKDALLDYDNSEDTKAAPLFSEAEANSFNAQFGGGSFNGQSYSNSANQNYTTSSQFATPESTGANYNFMTPTLSNNLNQLPFTPQHYRPTSNVQVSMPEQTPEFPAHLTSMESSASEAGGPDNNFDNEIRRPASTSANRGTYSCTYHGCTLRFETPQKLQKHKREGHRQNAQPTPTITPGVGSGMSSAELMQRNSQSGPHKCTRINPTTGKPCNTEFSRPYDLTRHEDTIHNARKQKVKCALCIEDKTFSRNDALTRHMRVVHPEVDFPGKHRRRGAHD